MCWTGYFGSVFKFRWFRPKSNYSLKWSTMDSWTIHGRPHPSPEPWWSQPTLRSKHMAPFHGTTRSPEKGTTSDVQRMQEVLKLVIHVERLAKVTWTLSPNRMYGALMCGSYCNREEQACLHIRSVPFSLTFALCCLCLVMLTLHLL